VVLLERGDLLQQTISSLRAEGTRYHHRRNDGHAFKAEPLDPLRVLSGLLLVEESTHYVRKIAGGVPHVRLVYEDDLLEPERQQSAVDRVCSFLDLPNARVESELVKITPRRTRELVTNFDEITALLERTRLKAYLPDQDSDAERPNSSSIAAARRSSGA
jgi:LPS sulfotransferase NodH